MKNEEVKNKALGELIALNKIGVLTLLNQYGYSVNPKSNKDIAQTKN